MIIFVYRIKCTRKENQGLGAARFLTNFFKWLARFEFFTRAMELVQVPMGILSLLGAFSGNLSKNPSIYRRFQICKVIKSPVNYDS